MTKVSAAISGAPAKIRGSLQCDISTQPTAALGVRRGKAALSSG
jgi:hypothetical protein